jgi:hypothetical protein
MWHRARKKSATLGGFFHRIEDIFFFDGRLGFPPPPGIVPEIKVEMSIKAVLIVSRVLKVHGRGAERIKNRCAGDVDHLGRAGIGSSNAGNAAGD